MYISVILRKIEKKSFVSELSSQWSINSDQEWSGKGSKFNVDHRNVDKNLEKVFCFWENSIWIGCVKLSLLRREYLSWAVNVLTNSLKTLHSTKTDFFQFN